MSKELIINEIKMYATAILIKMISDKRISFDFSVGKPSKAMPLSRVEFVYDDNNGLFVEDEYHQISIHTNLTNGALSELIYYASGDYDGIKYLEEISTEELPGLLCDFVLLHNKIFNFKL